MQNKILVFSDSHGRYDLMQRVTDMHGASVDYIFFLGDCLSDIKQLKLRKNTRLYAVAGNCDITLLARELVVTVAQRKFLLHHGNGRSTDEYIRYASSRGCDVALCGHTHIPENIYLGEGKKPSYLFNPGTVSGNRTGVRTYGIIETDETNILFSTGKITI